MSFAYTQLNSCEHREKQPHVSNVLNVEKRKKGILPGDFVIVIGSPVGIANEIQYWKINHILLLTSTEIVNEMLLVIRNGL